MREGLLGSSQDYVEWMQLLVPTRIHVKKSSCSSKVFLCFFFLFSFLPNLPAFLHQSFAKSVPFFLILPSPLRITEEYQFDEYTGPFFQPVPSFYPQAVQQSLRVFSTNASKAQSRSLLIFLLSQFITVFQQTTSMKLNANNRQKLVLNRTRKASTPQKVQMEVINGLKLATLTLPLAKRDTNIIKAHSSIFRKQSQHEAGRKCIVDNELIRCRSISCFDNPRTTSKLVPSLQKLYSNQQEEKLNNRTAAMQIIHHTAREMMAQYRQRSLLTLRNNSQTLSFESLEDFLFDFGQKIIQRTNTSQKVIGSDDAVPNKLVTSIKSSQKVRQNFKIHNTISINEDFHTQKHLSYQTKNLDLHFEFQRIAGEKEAFWRIIEEIEQHRPDQASLDFLISKVKYLKEEVNIQEDRFRHIRGKIDDCEAQIKGKIEEIQTLEEKIKKNAEYLEEIQRNVKEMEGFISRQPNRILQQQAEGYKQREQQLFDLAFILQQSTPQSFATYIEECIMIPFESFKLTLSSFSNHPIAQGDHYIINHADMDSFKNSISAAYESTISKLRTVIEGKTLKIKNFVGIMRRLASYTIGKREYLTQINKKMAVVSVNTDKNLTRLENSLINTNASADTIKGLNQLKELIAILRSIYCEAEVFY